MQLAAKVDSGENYVMTKMEENSRVWREGSLMISEYIQK